METTIVYWGYIGIIRVYILRVWTGYGLGFTQSEHGSFPSLLPNSKTGLGPRSSSIKERI